MIVRSLIAAMLCIVMAGYGSWLVFEGLRTGQTKRRRIAGMDDVIYFRKEHPFKFSATIAVFLAVTALSSTAAALLVIRAFHS